MLFLLNSCRLFSVDWRDLLGHPKDVPWEDMYINSVLLLPLSHFVKETRLELMYIYVIINIRSSFIHLN